MIRIKYTLIVAVVTLFTFGVVGAQAAVLISDSISEQQSQAVRSVTGRVAIALPQQRLTDVLSPDPGGVELVQVVDSRGRIHQASDEARQVRLSSVRPTAGERFREVVECRPGRRCRRVYVVRVALAGPQGDQIWYVYAAKDIPAALTPGAPQLLVVALVLALAACCAGCTRMIVGRALAPVEAIRAQLAEISAGDLSRRVTEPPGEDEIARMARTANQILERLDRLARRQRQFTSDASHELRTPVAGLRASAEFALMYPDDTDLRATLRAMLHDTGRIEAITTDLLLLSRLDTGGAAAQARVDLTELVSAQVRGRKIDIRADLAPGVVVTGVPTQLKRLLGNLLDNAERHAHSMIEVQLNNGTGGAQLVVTDDGPGIPAVDRERVFHRFTRLDAARSRDTGGSGLGLPIARDIAHAHGGTLCIADSSRGARFVLNLPGPR